MSEPRRRPVPGLQYLVLLIALFFVAVCIIGFLAGPIGSQIFERVFGITLTFPSWLVVQQPEVHLPAPAIFHIGGFAVTNTMLATLLTLIVLVLGIFLVTRRSKLIPGRLQSAIEFLLCFLLDFCERVAGEHYGRKFFPVITTIFLFVMVNAWLALIPGFGPALYAVVDGKPQELIRGANTDINTALALALVSFVFVWYHGVKVFGVRFFQQYVNVGGFFRGLKYILLGNMLGGIKAILSAVVNVFVGILELFSVFIRIISFTFRLFGNMVAGEMLLLIAAFLVPLVLVIPFFGLELLVGLIQALIFGGLTLIFATLAVTPHESSE